MRFFTLLMGFCLVLISAGCSRQTREAENVAVIQPDQQFGAMRNFSTPSREAYLAGYLFGFELAFRGQIGVLGRVPGEYFEDGTSEDWEHGFDAGQHAGGDDLLNQLKSAQ